MRENFTSRVGRWSAAHRKVAVFGWLAFVIVAFMIGSAAGMVTLKSGEGENGQSRLADQTLAQQFPVRVRARRCCSRASAGRSPRPATAPRSPTSSRGSRARRR